MPHRKTFRDLDELVRLMPEGEPPKRERSDEPEQENEQGDVHDRLFERAWRKGRRERHRSS